MTDESDSPVDICSSAPVNIDAEVAAEIKRFSLLFFSGASKKEVNSILLTCPSQTIKVLCTLIGNVVCFQHLRQDNDDLIAALQKNKSALKIICCKRGNLKPKRKLLIKHHKLVGLLIVPTLKAQLSRS